MIRFFIKTLSLLMLQTWLLISISLILLNLVLFFVLIMLLQIQSQSLCTFNSIYFFTQLIREKAKHFILVIFQNTNSSRRQKIVSALPPLPPPPSQAFLVPLQTPLDNFHLLSSHSPSQTPLVLILCQYYRSLLAWLYYNLSLLPSSRETYQHCSTSWILEQLNKIHGV